MTDFETAQQTKIDTAHDIAHKMFRMLQAHVPYLEQQLARLKSKYHEIEMHESKHGFAQQRLQEQQSLINHAQTDLNQTKQLIAEWQELNK